MKLWGTPRKSDVQIAIKAESTTSEPERSAGDEDGILSALDRLG